MKKAYEQKKGELAGKGHKHKSSSSHGLCDSCGYNTLRLPNKELRQKGAKV